MTKEYLLSKTLGGADIIQHLIRKEFPDHIMHVKGQDCGECLKKCPQQLPIPTHMSNLVEMTRKK